MILGLGIAIALPLSLRADATQSCNEPPANELRAAEKSAHSSTDHERLAAIYHCRAGEARSKQYHAEEEMKKWGYLASRTKVPNTYDLAKRDADYYRSKAIKAEKLEASHLTAAKAASTAN